MKRSDFEDFKAALAAAETKIGIFLEIPVEDGYEEIEGVPAEWECDDFDRYKVPLLYGFPEIQEEYDSTVEVWATVDSEDRATRRAEGGY